MLLINEFDSIMMIFGIFLLNSISYRYKNTRLRGLSIYEIGKTIYQLSTCVTHLNCFFSFLLTYNY